MGKPVSSRKLYTIEAARRALKVGAPRLKQLLHDQGIGMPERDHEGNHTALVLTTDQFDTLQRQLNEWLTAREAATILNTSADQVRKLMAAGIFKSTRNRGRALLCPREEIHRLRAMIEALPIGHSEGYRPIRSSLVDGICLVELIRQLIEGRLAARRLADQHGIAGLLVHPRPPDGGSDR